MYVCMCVCIWRFIVIRHDRFLLSQSEFYFELWKSLILEGRPSQAGILLKLREGGGFSNMTSIRLHYSTVLMLII